MEHNRQNCSNGVNDLHSCYFSKKIYQKEEENMKIVINKCYGGFGLSHKAIMLYARLKGFRLYSAIDERNSEGNIIFNKCIPYRVNKRDKPFLIYYSRKPLTKNGKIPEKAYFSSRDDIERNDPILIKVVEKLGEEANGDHARLKIVEIPDGVEWEIDEYDGMESVHEKHHSWF